jgi:hypothetical protein
MRRSVVLAVSIVCWSASTEAQQSQPDNSYKERQAKVARIVSAAARGINEAAGVPYFVGYDQPKRQSAESFGNSSLAQFVHCSPSNPRGTGINWLTVEWDCPANTKLPWASAATSFKFSGNTIVEIRTTPGAPRVSLSR